MKNITIALAATLTVASLAACSPSMLQAAVQAARDAEKGGASPAPGASAAATAAPTATASAGASASTAPIVAPSAGGAADADLQVVADAYMAAVDAAAAQDPERVARLFVAGLVACDINLKLGRAMMGYAMWSRSATDSAASPTGFEPQVSDEIYFRTLERDTKLGRYYLDKVEAGDLPFDEAADHVVIDKEYKAIDQGLSQDGKMWTFYVKVNHPNNVRSRPVRLQQDGSRGWRVSNYSSLMVQP